MRDRRRLRGLGDDQDANGTTGGDAMTIDRDRAARAVSELLAAIGEDASRPGLQHTPARVADAAAELFAGVGVDPVPALREGRFSMSGGRSEAAHVVQADAARLDPAAIGAAGGEHEDAARSAAVDDEEAADRPLAASAEVVADAGSRDAPHPDTLFGTDLIGIRHATFRSMCEHHLLPFTGEAHLAYVPGDGIVGLGRLYDLVETVSSRLTLQERMGDDLVDALMTALDAQGAIAVIEAAHGCVSLRGQRKEAGRTITVTARGVLGDPARRAEAVLLLLGGREPQS